jgi:hypothetical protein
MAIRDDFRSLFTLRPSPVRWPIALQAAIAIGIPIIGFAIAGQPSLGLLASSGGFTALYLSSRSRRERAVALPLVALGLIAASAVGALAAGSLASSIIALVVVAIGACVLCLGLPVGPPGAMFFVLLTGVASRLVGPASLGGDELSAGLVIGMLAIGCVISYLVVMAPLLLPSVRRKDAALHLERPPIRFQLDGPSRIILERIVVATVIAGLLATPLGIHRAYWVMLAVVVILQNGHRVRLTALRAVHRVLGTLIGVALFALILVFEPRGIVVGVVVMVLQFIVEVIVIRNYGLALVFITPLALIIADQSGSADIGETISVRVLDTLLGALIALVVLFGSFLARRLSSIRNPRMF